ncbi:MAG: ATPase, T2SS/T4P/T4SS family [Gemmatimonadota bacterium]|jgi:type II secretory ATPase GspE/PulE/Tfp pilus assembly ATPase PilB-like protein/CheY-like chemotaxis protein
MSETKNHWLKTVAQQVGLDLAIPAQPDVSAIRKAWPHVVKASRMPDDRFTQKLAGHFRIGVADTSAYDPQAVRLIPEAVARRHGILAMSFTEGNVVVATSDPANRAAIQDIVEHSGRQPVLLLASPRKLAESLERAYAPSRRPRNALQTLVAKVAESDFQVVTNQGMGMFTSFELEDPDVVKLGDIVLQQGLRYRATEIHVEPGKESGRVRYRIDGVLQHVVDLPPAAHRRLVARLKHLAHDQPGKDPDDGFEVRISNPNVVKTAHLLSTPTPGGELVWIRLVDPNAIPTVASLNFGGLEAKKIEQVLARQDGLVLVTGPARSGTSSFIYAALHALQHQSVISLEGRPELELPGVTQIKYDPSTGQSFAQVLQQLLDRNPDVIHAGEIRDLATARIALRTAVTGRKILATVHTSDAVSGVRRLMDMGLDGGRLAESLHAVVSLRLLRGLCTNCTRPFDAAKDQRSREAKLAAVLGAKPVNIAVGCKTCAGTGYFGQIPVPEVLVMGPELRNALGTEPDDAEMLRAARDEGMRTFSEVGLERVANGETTFEEIERVLGSVPVRDETTDSLGPILVVDDEQQDLLLVGSALRDMGFEVVEAPGGVEATRLINSGEHDFSLIVTDLFMPEMDGKEFLRNIRHSLSTQTLPVVVLTSSDDPRDEFELLEAGADDFLLKPVVIDRLEARVRAVLRRSGVRLSGDGEGAGRGSWRPTSTD